MLRTHKSSLVCESQTFSGTWVFALFHSFIEVYLIYKLVLVSGILKSGSDIDIYPNIYTFFFRFFYPYRVL